MEVQDYPLSLRTQRNPEWFETPSPGFYPGGVAAATDRRRRSVSSLKGTRKPRFPPNAAASAGCCASGGCNATDVSPAGGTL